MMRSTKVIGILLLSAVLVFIYGYSNLISVKEMILFTEDVLEGDIEAVEGLHLNYISQMNNQHFWDVQVPLGNVEDAVVSYEYYSEPQYEWYESDGIMEISFVNSSAIFSNLSVEESVDNQFEYLTDAILDVASRATVGESYTETILISDYYDYYPLYINPLSMGERAIWMDEETRNLLQSYFQYPVLEGHECEITILTYEDEGIEIYYNASSSASSSDKVCLDIRTFSYAVGNQGFLVLQDSGYELVNDELVEFQHTKFYTMDFSIDGSDFAIFENIEHIGDLPESQSMQSFAYDGEVLVAAVLEGDRTYLNTYDAEDFSLIQQVEVNLSDICNTEVLDGGFFMECESGEFVILEKVDGSYEVAFEGKRQSQISEEDMYYYSEEFNYIDGKLAIAQEYGEPGDAMKGILVTCYDETGLLYAGAYSSSQRKDVYMDVYGYNVRYYEPAWIA